MVLFYAAAFVLLAFFSVIFLGRFFAKVVEVIARCFVKLDLTLETFGFLSVIGIKIKLKNNRIIEIENISLKTKWTHSNSRKLFTIYFGKTLITQEGSTTKKTKPNVKKKGPNNFINSHKERISQFINLFCQYIAISFSEVAVILKQSDNRLIQCKLQDGLDISANPTGKCLNAVILINKVVTELNYASDKRLNNYENVAEASVEVSIEVSIQPLEGISSADIQLNLRSLCMIFNDGLLTKNEQPVAEPSLSHLAEAENRMLSRGENTEQLETTKLWSSLAKAPKHVELSIENSSISFINKDKRSLIVDVTHIISSFVREGNTNVTDKRTDINLVISGISVSGLQSCKLCTMNRFRLQAKLSEHDSIPQLATSVSIESFHNNYIHDDCMYWMEYYRSQTGQRPLAKTGAPQKRSSKRSLPFNVSTKLDLELIDCSTCFYLMHKESEQPLCRAVLALFTTTLKIPSQDLGEANHGIQEISVASCMENAYVYFEALNAVPEALDNLDVISYTLPDDPALLPNTNSHVWGRMLAMGSCSVQCQVTLPCEDDDSLLLNIRGEANSLALEWSHQVCRTLLQITKQFTQGLSTMKDNQEDSKPRQKTKVSLDTEFRIRGINVFYLGSCADGVDSFMYRTDMVLSTFSSGHPVLLDIFGVKVSRMLGLKKEPYRCLLSKELDNQCVSVPTITISLAKDKVTYLSLQDVTVDWNPTLHMALYDRLQEVTQDVTSMKEVFVTDSTPQVDQEQEEPENTQESHKGFNLKCDVSFFKLQMETSPSTRSPHVLLRCKGTATFQDVAGYCFGVELRKSSLELQNSEVTVDMETAVMLFDDKNTFTFKGVYIQRSQEVEVIKNLRKMFANLNTLNNTTWIVAVQSTTVLFPYQFDFATSRSELVNVVKMLKMLHKKPRDASYVERLPPDLWLRFEGIALEIEDDPFEVKLGDNYALLQEEAKHWTDRKETLENRLQAIRMTPGNLLTVKKEKMLFQKLLEKNAELYIQRSKALYSKTPMRRNLLVWEFESLDLKILADESYHGKVKAVEMMTKLNSESTFPSELEFSTLWCRTVKGTLDSHSCRLRDYPRAIFTSKEVKLCGTFLGAEQAANNRAKYSSSVSIKEPWGDRTVQRSLTALKFFYDLDFDPLQHVGMQLNLEDKTIDMDTLELAWGVDTDPAIAMVSLAFENLSKPSKDPSKPLPFYDKIRLLLHGRLHMDIKKWLMFFSATRNPYNTTERLEVDWMNVDLLWTNGRIEIAGDFTLQTRTASRYDDREVLHFPAFKVCSNMEWNCSGDANDHHSIMPFAPSKLPELAPNKAHDSYALFRSQSLTLHLSLETAMDATKNLSQFGPPYVCLYASTLRWFNNYQEVALRNTSRPIKRGRYFNRIAPKKQTLGRHYKEVSLSLKFPKLSVWYWGSFSQQRGFEMTTESGSLHTQYRLSLRPFEGGLSRRPAADWTATKLHIEIREITCHLYGLDQTENLEDEEQPEVSSIDLEPTKYYFLTTESLEYSRQAASKQQPKVDESEPDSQSYVHQLVCHGSKGVWTLTNRKIIFGLFEAYTNAEVLKKNLSADALKITIVDKKQQKTQAEPRVPLPKNRSMSLLQKLVNEKDSKFTVFTEEGTGTVEPAETPLLGVSLCTSNDVIAHTWHIKLVNTQILLQGTETKGGVLVTAGNATVLNRLHRPVWSKTELLNKKTWVGTVENLQYFATVSPDDCINLNNIPWLDTTVITGRQSQEKTGFDIADLANIVGSGEAVGGVVTSVVGGTTAGAARDIPQLQRIVARCGCEFYFVNFSTELDPLAEGAAPNSVPQSPASSNHLRVNRLPTVDTYTIRHKLLEISTNSSQYLMLIDIVNNVVFYTEPEKKEANERLQKMTFRLQLSASEDQRAQILKQQNIVRHRQTEMRGLQRQLYELNLIRKQALENLGLTEAMIQLEREITREKELLNSASTELKLLISAYKDFQMNLNPATLEKAPSSEPTKIAEVHFNHASWQLNQADGQLEIADATFRNFSYSKTTLSDATIEHRFEVPKFNVRNLLPNSIYKDVLTQRVVSGQGPKDRAVMVRLYCRVKPPVGGIGVKEHLEVNVCPLSVGLTYRLFRKVMAFFFPQREHEYEGDTGEVDLIYRGGEQELDKDFEDGDLFVDDLEDNLGGPRSSNLKRCSSTASSISTSSEASTDSGATKSKKSMTSLVSYTDAGPSASQAKEKGKKKSTFYRPLDDHDDLEKMKERASKNHSFIYVKVTEVLLCVSYKGEKEKNIVDVHNFNLTLPTLEYHNRTWTWHDLLIAMKKDCINVLVSQIIKEKLHLKGRRDGDGAESKDSKSEPKEEDKAKLLFGDRSKTEKKKSKKSLLGKLVKKTRLTPKPSGLLQPDGAGPEPVNLEGEEYEQSAEEEAPDSDSSPFDTKF